VIITTILEKNLLIKARIIGKILMIIIKLKNKHNKNINHHITYNSNTTNNNNNNTNKNSNNNNIIHLKKPKLPCAWKNPSVQFARAAMLGSDTKTSFTLDSVGC
jgi:hypothetical protein